jgi:phosphoglycolate phosphatase
MRRRWRGIIWDLDGTLADTLRDIADAANIALAHEGRAAHPVETYRALVGRGSRLLIEQIAPAAEPASIDRMHAAFMDHYGRHALDHAALYDGIADTLRHFAGAGVPMAVLSNKPHEFTLTIVEALAGDIPFLAVVGQRHGHARKPDPAEAISLCDHFRLRPANVAMVGDSEIDMETACRAGTGAVGVSWGFRDEQTLRKAGAELIITRPAELHALVG